MIMPLPNVDIESLIPHRDRIKMINDVLEIMPESAVAEAEVKPDWPLCNGKVVPPVVLIEIVAQTAALIDGYKRKKQGKPGGKGWLVGVKNAQFNVAEISVGTRLIASVVNSYSFDNYSVIKGTIKAGEEILAVIVLQALRMNENPTKD
jgi:predicted hotdog family 3-hydroxylacyl-ACP dehydratase